MKKIFPAIAALALAGSLSPVHAATMSEMTGANSALGIAPTTKDFVNEAAKRSSRASWRRRAPPARPRPSRRR